MIWTHLALNQAVRKMGQLGSAVPQWGTHPFVVEDEQQQTSALPSPAASPAEPVMAFVGRPVFAPPLSVAMLAIEADVGY